jgi:3-dehydrosphinganine reductase
MLCCPFDRSIGLADTLRSEMKLYDVDIHCFMPAGIDSEGKANEEVAKPAVTKKIEEGDECVSPEACAMHLIRGECLLNRH